ncbi:phospholipase B-like protein [Mucilaginibacter gracilis]|uniref:Phospholipase B-like protein n=1 Tax=Mucilaginibacter gracilis TaxID=423350 RepID=A0A495IWB1_9SPHI|nr:C45 family peptidase [Mucilaginibacter gracilis]RKR80288.1 phospholipase B-like protein [Mucilaginibacter gracilis]
MKLSTALLALALLFCLAISCKTPPADRMAKATRTEKNGWIYVHLEGSPADIGYQHGYLLSKEIDTLLHIMKSYLPVTSKKDWNFYRNAALTILWPKLEPEYQTEIKGIALGLQAKGMAYDSLDVTALNAYIELSSYYVPSVLNKIKADSANNRAPGNCSAFIANGKYTKDGKIVMGHNNWTDYIIGERWNVIADIIPEKGNHILMDCLPGFIHSGDDFLITKNGMLITETTITQFKGFDTTKTPECMRARKAAQYSNSIDDVIKIMTTDNNGGYANDWLIGDTKTNEVAKLELGLKSYRVWRSKDTAIIGSNFASDPKLIAEETTFKVDDKTTSPNARKLRMGQLMEQYKGKLDENTAKIIEGDRYDALQNKEASNRCVISGHVDEDMKGCPEWDEPPYFPMGAVQSKVTTTALAGKMQFWAHMGHPDGQDFLAAPFFKLHPQYKYQSNYLRDMKAYPWTLFEAGK